MAPPALALAALPLQLVCQLIVPGDTTTDNVTEFRTPNLPEGYVPFPDINMAYKIYDNNTTWQKARKLCLNENAQLATIDTRKKLEKLAKLRTESGLTSKKFTNVGIHSFFDEGEWVSIDKGISLWSLPWAIGEPTNNYKCVMINWYKNGLSNGRCDYNVPNYVCEIPIPISKKSKTEGRKSIQLQFD